MFTGGGTGGGDPPRKKDEDSKPKKPGSSLMLKLTKKKKKNSISQISVMAKLAKKRKEREESGRLELKLGEEPQLIMLKGKLAQNYKEALKKIGRETNLSSFKVDRFGYSPELAKELGYSYLGGKIIIAAPEQLKAGILNHDYKIFMPLMDYVSERCPEIVHEVVAKEALYCTIKSNLPSIIAGSMAPLSASLIIETPKGSISRIRDLQSIIKKFSSNPGLLLSDSTVESAMSIVQELNNVYGIIPIAIEKDVSIGEKFGQFKEITQIADIYHLSGPKPLTVCFPKGNKRVSGYAIDGNDTSTLMDRLYDIGYITFTKTLLRKKLLEKAKGESDSEKIFSKAMEEGEEALRMIEKLGEEVFFKQLPPGLKVELSKVDCIDKSAGAFIEEIIAKSWNDPFMLYQHCTTDFKNLFNQLSGEAKKELLHHIASEIKYMDQNNIYANRWLKINYEEMCNELGIKFEVERKTIPRSAEIGRKGRINKEQQKKQLKSLICSSGNANEASIPENYTAISSRLGIDLDNCSLKRIKDAEDKEEAFGSVTVAKYLSKKALAEGNEDFSKKLEGLISDPGIRTEDLQKRVEEEAYGNPRTRTMLEISKSEYATKKAEYEKKASFDQAATKLISSIENSSLIRGIENIIDKKKRNGGGSN
ncbi:MAG: hypothetical protein ABIB71_07895 [Candidatus Woesearchaeota archaeon]